ncbi:MAG: hypothetical protein JXB34_11770 [Bacteroidales bacterium]|nr:hypothetical protein [Bacteroidales bacterium]
MKNLFSLVKAYTNLNLILAGVVLCIFIYSALYSYKGNNYPIHSFHDTLTGEKSASTGLSRSFSAIVRFDFTQARLFNSYGVGLFLFFITQLFLRLFFIYFATKNYHPFKIVLISDIVISTSLFVVFFKPFISEIFCF